MYTSSRDAERKAETAHGSIQAVALGKGNGREPSECERRGKALKKLARVSHRQELLEIEAMSDVRRARAAGATWAEIGTALRVSQQVVSKKYGALLKPQVHNAPVTRNRNESTAF